VRKGLYITDKGISWCILASVVRRCPSNPNTLEPLMTITTLKIKFLGKTEVMFRVMQDGQVVQVFNTQAEAAAWVASNV
jgi:hypothetical protein